eukprot:11659-Heterococcus_DN1.PRE.2
MSNKNTGAKSVTAQYSSVHIASTIQIVLARHCFQLLTPPLRPLAARMASKASARSSTRSANSL